MTIIEFYCYPGRTTYWTWTIRNQNKKTLKWTIWKQIQNMTNVGDHLPGQITSRRWCYRCSPSKSTYKNNLRRLQHSSVQELFATSSYMNLCILNFFYYTFFPYSSLLTEGTNLTELKILLGRIRPISFSKALVQKKLHSPIWLLYSH